jgi:1-acyl-sn-glycerol-3-phosphate acyltransferase
MEQAQDRIEVLKKREEYEKKGWFDVDLENDPPFEPIKPEEVDYLKKKFSSKIKRDISYYLAAHFVRKIIKNKALNIKEINGLENLDKVESGAIVTCNHFNPLDNFAIYKAFEKKLTRKERMYKIIREGNYRFPGLFGYLFRNCDTLPLSSNKQTLQKFLSAVDTLLQNGQYVLIYPEQAMWWNYKKIRPFKTRAFKFAVKNNVPVIPCFITLKDSGNIGPDGFDMPEYYIHIMEPIYPSKEKTVNESAQEMADKNYQMCVEVYEKFYGVKMEYTTEKD